jgi:GntR family transcriptional regulator
MSLFTPAEVSAVSALLPTPLYHQLSLLLRSKIERGELRHGDLLPSEAELCAELDIARVTAKRALDELQAAGFIERRRGRGSHVIYRYEPKTLRAPLTSIMESLLVMGRETSVQVLDFRRIAAPETVAHALKLTANAPVDRAVRVRSSGDLAFAYYLSHTLPLGPEFNARTLKSHSRIELFQKLGVRLSEVDQLISATSATAEVAKALELPLGAPVLQLTRVYFDDAERPVDHLLGYYRPDRFQYHMRLSAPTRWKERVRA